MKKLFKCLLLGLLIGDLLSPAIVQAQFTVFDPAQYSLQIERQIEEANRWLERVRQYTEEINKLAEATRYSAAWTTFWVVTTRKALHTITAAMA